MKIWGMISVLAFSMALMGCGGGGQNGSSESQSENYKYDLTQNGCKTESHSFSSKAAYCAGLQDDALNKHCAWSMRRDLFTRDGCSGTFQLQQSTPAAQPPASQNPTPVNPPIVADSPMPVSVRCKSLTKFGFDGANEAGEFLYTASPLQITVTVKGVRHVINDREHYCGIEFNPHQSGATLYSVTRVEDAGWTNLFFEIKGDAFEREAGSLQYRDGGGVFTCPLSSLDDIALSECQVR